METMGNAAFDLLVQRALVAVIALLIAACLRWPDRHSPWHPGSRLTILLKSFERRLNREKRSREERRRRGIILIAAVMLIALIGGYLMHTALWQFYYGVIVEILVASLLLSLRPVSEHALELAERLEVGTLAEGRDLLMKEGVWRNAMLLDHSGVAKAGVESIAVQLNERLISPIVWYLALGLPGMALARAVGWVADGLAHAGELFGRAAVRLAEAVHFVPGVITAMLMVAVSLALPFAQAGKALLRMVEALHTVNGRIVCLSTLGAALEIPLGGPLSVYARGQWAGTEKTRPTAHDIRHAVWILWGVAALSALGLGAAVM